MKPKISHRLKVAPRTRSVMVCRSMLIASLALSVMHAFVEHTMAQEANIEEANTVTSKLPLISDEPRLFDPSDSFPEQLSVRRTVDLSNSSLGELIEWLRDECGLMVMVRNSQLQAENISLAEPISDWLNDAPVYQVLNRLERIGIAWYIDNDVVFLTSPSDAEQISFTKTYDLTGLLDAGYRGDRVVGAIQSTVHPTTWESAGGVQGQLNLVGDILFVRNTARVHQNIAGLVTTLLKPARQTLIHVPANDVALHDKLDELLSVEYLNMPLEYVINELGTQAKSDLRLDRRGLAEAGVRERQPISITVSEQPLRTILDYIAGELQLAWTIRDGVLWLTSEEYATASFVTAVYDVSDLCANAKEADALSEAISSQLPEHWLELGGESVKEFARSQTLVVWAVPTVQRSLLALLEQYRAALRMSRNRQVVDDIDPFKIVYYRLDANVAADLYRQLPLMVDSDSWNSSQNREGRGRVRLFESPPDFESVGTENERVRIVRNRKVLVVEQRQSIHDKIKQIIDRIEHGDRHEEGTFHGKGGMGGMGFGGGYFRIAP